MSNTTRQAGAAGTRAAAPWRRARRAPGRRRGSAASVVRRPSTTSTSSSSATAARSPSAASPRRARAASAPAAARPASPRRQATVGAGRLARLRRRRASSSSSRRAISPRNSHRAELVLERRAIGRARPRPRPGRGRRAPAGRGGSCRGPSTRAPAPRWSISVCRALGAGDLVDVLVDAVDRAELLQQLRRGLVADAGHALDVVAGVALQADVVGHGAPAGCRAALPRAPACRPADRRTPRGVIIRRDVVGHQLEGVAVGGHDARRHARLVGDAREGADHVVGLPARDAEVLGSRTPPPAA